MLEHSKAKVDLYATYLSIYLSILSRVKHIKEIHIYDLMCGEGIYADESKGSPIALIDKIKEHYFLNNETCPDLKVWLNDNGVSEIENDQKKIDRVKNIISSMFVPSNVEIDYFDMDFSKIYPKIKSRVSNLTFDKALFFIDPYGYKDVMPEHIKGLLINGNTEIILFLPVSHMYRFAHKSISDEDFKGGAPLKEFLESVIELSEESEIPKNKIKFIEYLKQSFKNFLSELSIFVDTFTIERDKQNIYCLFFFTPSVLGFEKMLEAKWKLDESQGKGFTFFSGPCLFSELELSDYPERLEDYIKRSKKINNADVYLFGLKNGFLPKHTRKVFKSWQNSNNGFKVSQEDGTPTRRSSFYISCKNHSDNPDKRVFFEFDK